MSLRKAMRNARAATNYEIGKPPREREMEQRHIEILPDAGTIQFEAVDGTPKIELTED